MSSFKDWLTVTWAQGGTQLRPDGSADDIDDCDAKARCGRAGSLAVTPGERLLELLRPSATPRRHSAAATCTPPPPTHAHANAHTHTHFKYCPSDALPYCPPSALPPTIRLIQATAPPLHQIQPVIPPLIPPPIPQRTCAPPPPARRVLPLIPPPRRTPPPAPPRPGANTATNTATDNTTNNAKRDLNTSAPAQNKHIMQSANSNNYVSKVSSIPPPLQPISALTGNIATSPRTPFSPSTVPRTPFSPPAVPLRQSPSETSNVSARQDSNISSDSFSQTSSPSYTTKTMETPLLPQHKTAAARKSRELKPADTAAAAANAITKSTSTPASLQTIVRFQNGSNMSLHHKIMDNMRVGSGGGSGGRGRLGFRLAQVLVNAIALMAIAGGFAAYFRAYPTVKVVNRTVVRPMMVGTPVTPRNPAPGVCLPVIVSFCQAHRVSYNFTIFPNYIGHFGQRDAQEDLEIYDAVVDVRCYELTALFLCSIFVPKCGPLGHMVRPCRSLCHETMRRCGFFLDVFGLSMPDYLQCDLFPESLDTDVCIGNREVRDARIRAQKPVCPSGFQCDVRRCIPLDWRCDGHVDCLDQSDELNCRSCARGTIHCGERQCVAQSHICDGKVDCPWGQDERNCLRLSEENGDVGAGRLQLWRPAQQEWLPACVAHWDRANSPNTVCHMLGYQTANSSQLMSLEGGEGREDGAEGGEDGSQLPYQRRESSLLREFRDCSSTSPTVHLTCQHYVCGRRRTHPRASRRIVGGVEAAPGDWPFLAAILGGPEEVFYCAGVLIADQWVLTASHCVGNHSDVSGWTIQLGITRRRSHAYYGQKAKVRRVVPHPLYNIGVAHDNDIALFQLTSRVRYNEHLSPVCLPPPTRTLPPGSLCTVIGWGKRDDKDMSEYEPAVNEVTVPVLNRDLCNAWLEHRDLNVTEGMICAGYPEGGKDACQGDSGGPLLCRDPDDHNRWYVGGIVSWGIKCAHPRLPGVYAFVPKYVPWIHKQIQMYNRLDDVD